MPCIEIVFDVWVCFTYPFVDLLMSVCDKYINCKVMALKKVHAAMEALLLHMVASLNFSKSFSLQLVYMHHILHHNIAVPEQAVYPLFY